MTLQRVHRITVESWRNWQDPLTIDGLGPGLVVLSGPNAVGKSGLWQAVVLGLLDRHWGGHTERLRPAGTKRVVPRVEIEFEAGGKRYRIEKHFGGAAARDRAKFSEGNGGRWTLRDEGEEAYRLCREAVLGTQAAPPGRGGLEQALKDTLLELLLAEQGTLVKQIATPGDAALAVTDRGAATAATKLEKILRLVSAEADRWWTEKRSDVRKGTDLARDLVRLEEAAAESEGLEAAVRRIDDLVRRIGAATDEIAGAGDPGGRLAEAEKLVAEAHEHRERREEAWSLLDAASRKAADAEAALEERRRLLARAADWSEKLGAAQRGLAGGEADLDRESRALKAAEAECDARGRGIHGLRAWLEFETRDAQLRQLRKDLKAAQDRRATAKDCRDRIEELEREKAGLRLPQPAEWKSWDELDEVRKRAEGRLEAGAWALEGALPAGFQLEVDGAPAPAGPVPPHAKREVRISAPSGETLRLSAPAADAAEAARSAARVREFLDRFGAGDIVDLRARQEHVAGRLQPEIDKASGRMVEALKGQKPEDLLREEGRLQAEIERAQARPTPQEPRPEGSIEEWRLRLEALDRAQKEAEGQSHRAAARVAGLEAEVRQARLARDQAESEHKLALVALEAHRGSQGPEGRLEEAARALAREKADAEAVWKPLDEARGAAETAKETRSRGLSRAVSESMARRDRIKRMEGELAELRREDPEGRLAGLEAERAALAPRAKAGRCQADALLLLERALIAERDRLTEAVGGPIQKRLLPWVRYLLQDESEVVVAEDGWPRVVRKPWGQEVPFEDESFGTREQVGVLFRLAVADLLAGSAGAGVCIMLDDPFGHTDRGRRRRLLELLQSEAERRGHQILLFTCRPEDFEGVGQHVPVGG